MINGQFSPAQRSHPAILSVRDLQYTAPGGQTLLDEVSFDVERGAILAIAGPNGAGKTTLLNLMSGLQKPTSGEILIDGKSLTALSAAQRARQIAVVSQQSSPDARLSLRDYVALGQLPIWSDHAAREHAEALDHTLEKTGLERLGHKPMGQVSGGERQRAHIARALVQQPQLLILDEPTNHLDPDAKGRVLSLVTALGVTVVMVIHDLVMIPEFATHVALMKDARLTAFGLVGDIQTPAAIHQTFGVDYRLFDHGDRQIPALDIRKSLFPNTGANL
ncbi:MAG: ABC transporter ATP-binding protein [Pseudomonadota bacterium]